jgi:hypothetical protein
LKKVKRANFLQGLVMRRAMQISKSADKEKKMEQQPSGAFAVDGYFCAADGSPGVKLTTTGPEFIYASQLVECGATPPPMAEKGKVPSWSLRSSEGEQLSHDNHLLFKLSVWHSLTSFHAGKDADRQETLLHIVTRLPYCTVRGNLRLIFSELSTPIKK